LANLSDINEHLEWYEGARIYRIYIIVALSISGYIVLF
jgi:hypothetical protein